MVVMGGVPNVPDTAPIVQLQQKQGIDILRLLADATLTPTDYDTLFLDIFSDAGGYSNSIDAGNTTATFSTDKYINLGNVTEATGAALGSTSATANTEEYGELIKATVACNIVSVTKNANCTATKINIYDKAAPAVLLATANFAGDVATLATPLALTANQEVGIFCGSAGGWNRRYNGGASYPINGTNINFTGSVGAAVGAWDASSDTTQVYNIASIVTQTASNKVIQTNAITLDANVVQYSLYSTITTTGSGSVTYDISFDNGATWKTDKALNTVIEDVGTGTQGIIKLKLNGAGAANTAEAENYALAVWY